MGRRPRPPRDLRSPGQAHHQGRPRARSVDRSRCGEPTRAPQSASDPHRTTGTRRDQTMTQTRTIRPGLLVSLKTTVTGNVSYRKVDLEAAHIDDDGALRASWTTDKKVTDPAEHDEAVKVRGKCRSLITTLCAQSDFGLLCRQDNRADLDKAISEAQDLAREFNGRSSLTRVTIFAVIGVIAEDDAQATKAINSEVSALLSRME